LVQIAMLAGRTHLAILEQMILVPETRLNEGEFGVAFYSR